MLVRVVSINYLAAIDRNKKVQRYFDKTQVFFPSYKGRGTYPKELIFDHNLHNSS